MEILVYEDGREKPYDTDLELIYGPQPTFETDDWNRYDANDPDKPAGWKEFNERWDSRERLWTMPIDWVNYADHMLGKTSSIYTLGFRY
jgi:hypothetical protein